MSGFRHVGDRLVHRGYIWNVVEASFVGPDGEHFARDVVRSPGAVGVVPIEFVDGAPVVVLVRQYRAPFDDHVVEIPAGMRDVAGEPPVETAARELAEEVGLVAAELALLTSFLPSAGMTDSVLHLYLGTGLTHVARSTHGPEEAHMEVFRLPLAEAVERVTAGEITDAKTVIGLLLADRRLAVAPPR
jgi:ADP-ribose pyrophosphatase